MPVRAVCKPHSPDLKRGALATDARGCSLWRSFLERPPPAPESRVRDPLGELVRTRVGGVTYIPFVSIVMCFISYHILTLAESDCYHTHLFVSTTYLPRVYQVQYVLFVAI